MSNPSADSTPVWLATADLLQPPPLSASEAADVCVVGAGIAGITTAYMLALEGRSVAVLDDGALGSGETHRTTAHLVNALDDRYFELERLHGSRGAELAAQSHTSAIAEIETIVRRESIDCDFERLDGYLFVPEGESPDLVRRELDAAKRAGVDVEY